jgi:hypothetical protein
MLNWDYDGRYNLPEKKERDAKLIFPEGSKNMFDLVHKLLALIRSNPRLLAELLDPDAKWDEPQKKGNNLILSKFCCSLMEIAD